ncbi:MAG TPA: choice-of-anchor P family protein [Gemmatimonadales bacterium]|nr:choice-of-anchor P family protein [Gemmatimonadales bacterium]
MVGALVGALAVLGCSEAQNPAAPRPPSFSSSPSQSTTYSGEATVVQAAVLGVSTELVHAGPLPSSGGADKEMFLEASVPGLLTAEVLHASTVGQGNHSRSEASIAELAVTVGGNTISAGFLMARAEARCVDGTPATSGSSEIARLVVNGQAIEVRGEPNETITLPNGRVVINEQQSAGPGDLTVNALRVVVDGVADVIIASAHADIGCPVAPPPPPPSCRDFVTGGGWITGTPSGAKANFGVAGGLKNGALWGHLTYIDHGANLKVKGTGVTDYMELGPTSRRIVGTAEINGQTASTYTVDVTDDGEPGRNDTFLLELSNGYRASGALGGGNIQLHPCQ